MINFGWNRMSYFIKPQTKLSILFIMFLHIAVCLYGQSIKYEDRTYDDNIRSVQLYPLSQDQYPEFGSEIVDIRQQSPLILKFDELYYDFTDYYFKIYRCTADWEKSKMVELEYLYEYNEYPITKYDYSQNTKVPYTSYSVDLPRVKQAGNYVVAVYRRDEDKLILSKRFVIFENRVEISPVFGNSVINRANPKKHQFEFRVNYSSLESFSPLQDFSVIIRQNQRWDNMLSELAPSMIREDIGVFEFQGFAGENSMDAGNEFRFFDLRGYTYRGQSVGAINRKSEVTRADIIPDQPRATLAYSIINDRNGQYYNQTLEPGAGELDQDYIQVYFSLNLPKQKSKIYLLGEFNLWQKTKENLLQYNSSTDSYTTSIPLKQGYYDYIYWEDSGSPWSIEGSYLETENQYEIIVYYRAPGTLFDYPVGFKSISSSLP